MVPWDGKMKRICQVGSSLHATAINNSNTVIGTINNGTADLPFVYEHGKLTTLPIPDDAVSGAALGINDVGEIVGSVGTDCVPDTE